MSCRQRLDLFPGDAFRFEQCQDAGPILGTPHTERGHCQIISPHHPEWHALEIGCLRLFYRLACERAEDGNELCRRCSHADSLTLRAIAFASAKLLNATHHIRPVRRGHNHQHVGIHRGHRLGVAHLGDRVEQRVLLDNARRAHVIEQLCQRLHDFRLHRGRSADNIDADTGVQQGKIVPAGWLVMGVLAKRIRKVSDEELEDIRENALEYLELWHRDYRN